MGKGSRQRPRGLVTDQNLLDNWERIFNSKPNADQFVEQHKAKVAWRDELVKEDHEASLKEKDKDGNT